MLPEFLEEFPKPKSIIDSTNDRPEQLVYKNKLREFINFGEGSGVGRLSWIFLPDAFMDNESPFSNIDWAAAGQKSAITCEMDL